jgi:TrmH RNA methyltransferase
MVRSAAFFDAPFIVISETDAEARLTTSAYRVAEGGMEHVSFRRVRNTAAFLKAASGRLLTIGADSRARLRLGDLDTLIADKALRAREGRRGAGSGGLSRPGIAVVMGNEESGLPREVKDHCTALVRIPGTGAIESLNVAQAATLFLHRIYEL